ncbi:MAG: hypothetical protein JW751_10040 [Polyangiaceae bacterium]|nr:hypothetical protein [Polyangiaceae bacterium]
MPSLRAIGLRCGAALLLTAAAVRAERELSVYEEDVIEEFERATGTAREPAPDGKVVEDIIVYRLRVFDHRDPVPEFVNWFHTTTRETIVARELLLDIGQPYRVSLAQETERNLRDIYQLSLVLVVPLRGSTPDRVRLAVLTKDIWSLRVAWDPEISTAGFVSSELAVDEINLAGRLKTVSLGGGFDPGSYRYGLRYIDPRVSGSRQFGLVGAELIFDRATGAQEGSTGNVWYGQDLYSLDAKWGYDAFVGWRDDVERSFVGGELRSFDARTTAGDDALPLEWNRGVYYARYQVIRSFGDRIKLELSGGMEALREEYSLLEAVEPPSGRAGGIWESEVGSHREFVPAIGVGRLYSDAAAVGELRSRELPPSHQRVGPVLGFRSHSTRFLRTLDVDTLALQEDVGLGHDVSLRLFPASESVGSTRTMLGLAGAAAYTVRLGNGFVRAAAASIAELAGPETTDVVVDASVRAVSPRTGFGRFVFDGTVGDRIRDYHHDRYLLGGEGRLRGYPTWFLRGRNRVAATFEYRTTSVGFWGIELGGAAFLDVGDTPEDLSSLALRSSAGGGVRILFPMFDRMVFRIDVGAPLDRRTGGSESPWGFFAGFGQAVRTPETRVGTVPAAVIP